MFNFQKCNIPLYFFYVGDVGICSFSRLFCPVTTLLLVGRACPDLERVPEYHTSLLRHGGSLTLDLCKSTPCYRRVEPASTGSTDHRWTNKPRGKHCFFGSLFDHYLADKPGATDCKFIFSWEPALWTLMSGARVWRRRRSKKKLCHFHL